MPRYPVHDAFNEEHRTDHDPGAHDPIAFELFKNAILSIADEMALTIFRTAYSGVLKDNMDYSTALLRRATAGWWRRG